MTITPEEFLRLACGYPDTHSIGGLPGEEILVVAATRTDADDEKSRAVDSRSIGKIFEISIQYVKMPERMKMIIEWKGQYTGSYDCG